MPDAMPGCVDHLVYVVRNLDEAIDHLETMLGVRAAIGGAHPGLGTHNALIALGPACYLELLAPDPSQPAPAGERWLGVDASPLPRISTWAAKATNLHARIAHAAEQGVDLGAVREGKRQRPDGTTLAWQLSVRHELLADGLVPFLIDWGTSPHPAEAAPQGLSLFAMRSEHPNPAAVRAMLRVLGIDLQVSEGPAPALVATIQSPTGTIELR